MSNYKGILTNKGKELLANATMGNRVNFSHLALGDGNGSTPTLSETRTALIKERHRLTLNSVDINPNNRNQIVCETIIPTNIGGFTVRELGLYAGSHLVMHSTYPPTYKPRQDEGGAREMVVRVVINVQNADVVALYLDTSLVYATREWVETNFINHNEVIDNLGSNDANKPLSAAQGKNLQNSKLDKTANAVSATKLHTARTVSFSGAATGSFNYDGTANSTCTLTLVNSGVVANTYGNNITIPVITVNNKGLVTGISTQDIRAATTTTAGIVQLADTLTSSATNLALTAHQGKVLKGQIDSKLASNANAVSATKLHTAHTINGVAFDGTADITIQDGSKVSKSGNETIAGVKTFSSSPKAPTPTATSNDTTVATTAFVVREVDNLIGQVAFFAMNAAPTGWLKANGAAVSRTTYAKLFAKIGTTFGAGDGRTTFNLPDLRGEFVRGFDDGRRVDNGRTFGTAQKGTLVAPKDDAGAENVFAFSSSQEVYGDKNLSDYGQLQMFYSSSAVSTPSALAISMTAQIARPRNIALLACIKF